MTCSSDLAGELIPAGVSMSPPDEDYYSLDFSADPWPTNIGKKKKDPHAELTPILDKAGSALDEITHLNVMREILLSDKKKPLVKITGEITKDLADIPVPNLMIDIDKIGKYNGLMEREKFAPIVHEGDVAFNYNDDFKGTAKITDIVYTRDYQGSPKITITGIVTDK